MREILQDRPGRLSRLLARRVLGPTPYRSDDTQKQLAGHIANRIQLLEQSDQQLGLRMENTAPLTEQAITYASGDTVEASVCPSSRVGVAARAEQWGMPAGVHPLEGWVVTA